MNAYLKCVNCGFEHGLKIDSSLCPECEHPLSVIYDYEAIKELVSRKLLESRFEGIWKYRELLPCDFNSIVSLGEGNTLLTKCEKLGEEFGLKRLYVKDETKNPTGSFIDRGSSILTSNLIRFGFKGVYGILKGNLGASLAAYSAKAGIKCVAFTPTRIDIGKLCQIIAYGAMVYPESKFSQYAPERGFYFVDDADPFILEGKKTICFEVIEEFEWTTPEFMVAPIGSGGLISALWKAVKEFESLGLIEDSRLKLVGVQPESCAPVVSKFNSEADGESSFEETVAIDIAFKKPKRGDEAIKALRESGGYALKVSDEDMLWALRLLAKSEGVFAEPAAASTIACVKKLVEDGIVDSTDKIVCIVTGSGLKDPAVAIKELERSILVEEIIKSRVREKPKLGIGGRKIMILEALRKEPLHGYEVWKRMIERGVSITIPAVYQHLRELEEMGLISRSKKEIIKGRARKYYSMTNKGLELLKALEFT